MPELPEVETIVRDLRPLLVGKTIHAVHSGPAKLRNPWQSKWDNSVIGRTIDRIKRRGKWILVYLDDESLLVLHLGMTGQLTVHPVEDEMANHVHWRLELEKGQEELRFRDHRRFGSALYFANEQACMNGLHEKLGPEPFDLESKTWREAIQKSKRKLKALLMDQELVAGVGNIYADESLFVAQLHPEQTGKQTTPTQAEHLREAIVQVLTKAINGRGSTIRNYVSGSGLQGEYQDELYVYGRTDQPCMKCQTPIKVMRLGGRSTHYCPQCQVKPKKKRSEVRSQKSEVRKRKKT
jgi:formamidopyrimidine-DNA glycosylase